MIKLSIIIPMYNAEKTIEKCINSIIKLQNIEIVLIDDGSTDDTNKICLGYKNNKILYFYQENKGPGAARNYGITKANGQYIMFVDSDDYIDSLQLKEVINKYLNCDYDILYYNFAKVDKDGKIIKKYYFNNKMFESKKNLMLYTLSWKLPWGQFKILNKDMIKTNNIKFQENSKNMEELIFSLKCIDNAKKTTFINEILYFYYQRINSTSKKITYREFYKAYENVLVELMTFYGETEYTNGINNFRIISMIISWRLLLKEKVKEREIKKQIKQTIYNEVRLLKKENLKYIGNKYKMILFLIKFKLYFLVYLILKM